MQQKSDNAVELQLNSDDVFPFKVLPIT